MPYLSSSALPSAAAVGAPRLTSQKFGIESDGRTILEIRRHAALFVAHHLQARQLALFGAKGVRAAKREDVPVQVREDAVAVAPVDHDHRHEVVPGDDRTIEDLDLLLVVQLALAFSAAEDLGAVEAVADLFQTEARTHLVAMHDLGFGAGDAACQHGLFEDRQP